MFRAYVEITYLIGLVLVYAVRRYYGLMFRARGVREQAYKTSVDRFLGWLAELGLIAALVYLFTDWLAFADYPIFPWLGWAGVPILGVGIWLIWSAHRDLDLSWSPHVEIQRGQKLITGGVYRHIRHPMYAGYLLFGIGGMMTLANWIAGPAFFFLFGLLYLQRVRREEDLMLAQFGEKYQRYMQHTGRLLPRLNGRDRGSDASFLTHTKK